ncbi:hypothetical protein ACLKMH_15935 [Psychromonas sp. KJ10-10]|uniref:hypothetical protein n=1 Tax=Psychromonas sp. KJ10-10 TaxID=3391823 RepID=UPI0039B623B6
MLFSHSLIRGGVHPSGHKQLSNHKEITILAPPKRLYINLKQHTGSPAKAIVSAGDKVIAGQMIAKGTGSSANIHAPQSGVVLKIALHRSAIPGGGEEQMIHLQCDPEDQNEVIKLETQTNIEEQSRETLIDIIEEAGVVGMGGAVFPAYHKNTLYLK